MADLRSAKTCRRSTSLISLTLKCVATNNTRQTLTLCCLVPSRSSRRMVWLPEYSGVLFVCASVPETAQSFHLS